jgi:hypothetical protein
LGGAIGTTWAAINAPDITNLNTIRVSFAVDVATDLIPHGDIKMDWWRLETPVPTWTLSGSLCHPCTDYNISGDDDSIYLIGNNATPAYKYTISTGAWTPLTNAPVISGPGSELLWLPDYDPNKLIRIVGSTGTSYVVDYYNISVGKWLSTGGAITLIDSCDATLGWVRTGDAPVITVDLVNFKEGSGSINCGKPTTFYSYSGYLKLTIVPFDATGKSIYAWAYIKDQITLNLLLASQCLSIYLRGDSSNYYYKTTTPAQLSVGWNLLGGPVSIWSSFGSPNILNIVGIYFRIDTTLTTSIFADGDIKMDYWHYETADSIVYIPATEKFGYSLSACAPISGQKIYIKSGASTTIQNYLMLDMSTLEMEAYATQNIVPRNTANYYGNKMAYVISDQGYEFLYSGLYDSALSTSPCNFLRMVMP